jgi:16S rRNA (uracil1498-N3)-methyltransferase
MTRRRWIADQVSGDRAFLLGKNAEHLSRVLRARVGQQFEIATPGGVLLGEIIEIEPQRIVFSTSELPNEAQQHSRKIHLYLAVFKFDRLEWAIEKCTELGVSNIVPVIAQRTDAHLAAAAQKRVERWQRIVHEAAQQSRRDSVPEIAHPEKLGMAVAEAQGMRIVLSESERDQGLRPLVAEHSEISLAIGPEGGWTEAEMVLFSQNGWTAGSLGPTILRAETAAIAAVAVVQAAQ